MQPSRPLSFFLGRRRLKQWLILVSPLLLLSFIVLVTYSSRQGKSLRGETPAAQRVPFGLERFAAEFEARNRAAAQLAEQEAIKEEQLKGEQIKAQQEGVKQKGDDVPPSEKKDEVNTKSGKADAREGIDALKPGGKLVQEVTNGIKEAKAKGKDPDNNSKDTFIPVGERDYREIFSLTTRNRKYFLVYWEGKHAYNANIIPHPTKHDQWIVIAQHNQAQEVVITSEELVCSASFIADALICDGQPSVLQTAPSIHGICEGNLALANLGGGPRDARMFYGPHDPYVMYGSQSKYACFGLWLQDARMVLRPFRLQGPLTKFYTTATEIQRPLPWKSIEKNFFLFWDSEGKAYVHTDLLPKRVFARLNLDGSVEEDLAPLAEEHDKKCMLRYMPRIGPELESIHQATNSLTVSMCKRGDDRCIPDDSNTFIMHIFQHKWYFDYHSEYDPYVMLFKRTPPFELVAISQRPMWIHGRTDLTAATGSLVYHGIEDQIPKNHTEMFYITSMSWKSHGSKYHGFINDPLFLSFGIEDTRSGAIDILAGDLLQDMGYCQEL